METILISIGIFFVLLFLGVPIVVSVGVACIAIWIMVPGIVTDPTYMFQAITTSLDSFILVAVPMFILSGLIMAKGGIADKLFNFFSFFIGRFKAGLPCAVIVTCLFYGAISGSGPATAAAVGSMTIPVMIGLGYSLEFSAAIVAVAGGLGVIIPPSIPMIMYGSATNASVGDMFIAGVFPGLLIGLCLMIYAVYYCQKHPPNMQLLESNYRKLKSDGFFKTFRSSFLALLSPLIILGGIYTGMFTPTEAACISVVYSLLISMAVYKILKLRDIPELIKGTLQTVGPVLIIVGVSSVFGRALALLQVTDAISNYILTTFPTKLSVLLFINVFLLFIGCVMDTTPAILIFAPILWPICQFLGMNLIHFGIIMVVNLAIGFVTPPVGVNLFVTARISGVPVMRLAKHALPFILMFIIALLFITFIPELSLALVN